MNLNVIKDKHQRDRIRALVERGWTVARTGGGHLRLTHPSGQSIVTSLTTSDWRGWRNLQSDIRRIERQAVST